MAHPFVPSFDIVTLFGCVSLVAIKFVGGHISLRGIEDVNIVSSTDFEVDYSALAGRDYISFNIKVYPRTIELAE